MKQRYSRHYGQFDHLPHPISTRKILGSLKGVGDVPERQHNNSIGEDIKVLFGVCALTYLALLVYWPVARAFAWCLLFLAKLYGTCEGDLPPYTPYPHD